MSIDYALLYEEILGGEGVATKVDLFPASQDCPCVLGFLSRREILVMDWKEMTRAGLKWLVEDEENLVGKC